MFIGVGQNSSACEETIRIPVFIKKEGLNSSAWKKKKKEKDQDRVKNPMFDRTGPEC